MPTGQIGCQGNCNLQKRKLMVRFFRPRDNRVADHNRASSLNMAPLEAKTNCSGTWVGLHILSVWGGLNYCFPIFIFYAWVGMLLKSMGKSFLLSKDEPVSLNIDGVMALWIFRRRAITAKNWQKSAKIGPLESSFYLFFCPRPLVRCPPEWFFPVLRNRPRWKKNSGTQASTRRGWK